MRLLLMITATIVSSEYIPGEIRWLVPSGLDDPVKKSMRSMDMSYHRDVAPYFGNYYKRSGDYEPEKMNIWSIDTSPTRQMWPYKRSMRSMDRSLVRQAIPWWGKRSMWSMDRSNQRDANFYKRNFEEQEGQQFYKRNSDQDEGEDKRSMWSMDGSNQRNAKFYKRNSDQDEEGQHKRSMWSMDNRNQQNVRFYKRNARQEDEALYEYPLQLYLKDTSSHKTFLEFLDQLKEALELSEVAAHPGSEVQSTYTNNKNPQPEMKTNQENGPALKTNQGNPYDSKPQYRHGHGQSKPTSKIVSFAIDEDGNVKQLD